MRPAGKFSIEMLRIGDQLLRVGRSPGAGAGVPLLLFNGIGGNIELLEPLAARMQERELITFDVPGVGHSQVPKRPYRLPWIAQLARAVITFDVPGVGHSQLPRRPYRLGWIVRLACRVLDRYGHRRCDVLGVSWGGAVAQQFARSEPERCRRLILCATAAGIVGWRRRAKLRT